MPVRHIQLLHASVTRILFAQLIGRDSASRASAGARASIPM